jgi:thymidine kinase
MGTVEGSSAGKLGPSKGLVNTTDRVEMMRAVCSTCRFEVNVTVLFRYLMAGENKDQGLL